MERLTKRLEGGQAVFHECHGTCGTCDGANCYCIGPMVDRLSAYEDTGLEPEEIEEHEATYNECLTRTYGPFKQKISQWLQAERTGRLVALPCKVGDHVWADGREAIVVWFFGYKTERYLHAQFFDNAEHTDIPFYEIGKTVFLTREEAEDAMKEANHA